MDLFFGELAKGRVFVAVFPISPFPRWATLPEEVFCEDFSCQPSRAGFFLRYVPFDSFPFLPVDGEDFPVVVKAPFFQCREKRPCAPPKHCGGGGGGCGGGGGGGGGGFFSVSDGFLLPFLAGKGCSRGEGELAGVFPCRIDRPFFFLLFLF